MIGPLPWHKILQWRTEDGRLVAERGLFRLEVWRAEAGTWHAQIIYQGATIATCNCLRPDGQQPCMRSATKMACFHGLELTDAERKVFGKKIEIPQGRIVRIIDRAPVVQVLEDPAAASTVRLEVVEDDDGYDPEQSATESEELDDDPEETDEE